MSDESGQWIPRNLDAPALFYIWEADTSIIVIFMLILGSLLNMFILSAIAAFFLARGYRYLKEEGGRGLLFRILYWYTPSDMWLTKSLPSHQREYYG